MPLTGPKHPLVYVSEPEWHYMISREIWRLPEVSSVIKGNSDLPYMASTTMFLHGLERFINANGCGGTWWFLKMVCGKCMGLGARLPLGRIPQLGRYPALGLWAADSASLSLFLHW